MSRFSFFGWLWALVIAATSGAVYSVVVFDGRAPIGAAYAVVIIGLLLVFEQDLVLPRFRLWLMELPTAVYFLMTLILNVATIAVGTFVVGTLLWLFGFLDSWSEAVLPNGGVLIYALSVSALIVFVLRMRDLVGREVFASLLLSRYRRPRPENRVFLLVDLMGSTSYAERFGDLRTQRYLGEFLKTVALSVRRFDGTVDDYIGDAALITWRFEKGIHRSACIRCVLHILEAIQAKQSFWINEFGEVPRLRAALHGGPVIVAEIGLDHRKITYFGDTVNTTARIEGLARELGKDFLISDSLLNQFKSVTFATTERLGSYSLRGKGQSLSVTAISAAQTPP
ncbi:adenylate/guanylate cyclase domain-containing protein (plasmid) [Rhizobium sp. 32-5/1]|uniref:adenylate/guanylate cyclase domain-containing protein n=1 Tax=Rhizobium sp. 32-5/1 TaxID=3019602 RepID=UPI00240D157D|nr:adenylate/guanylate cyclase domain-containing protein [Rhizobium sp. 32-5/1]WEZ85423.1 adenylate/guanylate cyclase domain-containing protein [Rhizobium sp. 32-5/1]